jgi:hypothetical protein
MFVYLFEMQVVLKFIFVVKNIWFIIKYVVYGYSSMWLETFTFCVYFTMFLPNNIYIVQVYPWQ